MEYIRRSSGGQLLGNAMSAVGDIIYGKRQESSIIEEAQSEPEEDGRYRIELDNENKVVRVYLNAPDNSIPKDEL